MRQREGRLARPGEVERRHRRRMHDDASAKDPDLDPGMRDANARVRGRRARAGRASRRAAPSTAARSPWRRRNQRRRLRARAASAGKRHQYRAVERRGVVIVGAAGAGRIEHRQLIEKMRGLGVVGGGAHERGRVAGKRSGKARNDFVAEKIAAQARIGVGFVVDPGDVAIAARRSSMPCAAARAAGGSAPVRRPRARPASPRGRRPGAAQATAAAGFPPGRRHGGRARRHPRRRSRARRSVPCARSLRGCRPARADPHAPHRERDVRAAHSAAQNAAQHRRCGERP